MRLFEKLDEVMEHALKERDRRAQQTGGQWDGTSMRRSSDQKRKPVPVVEPVAHRESVLVVDDSATVRAFMRIKLSPFQFDVDFAGDGRRSDCQSQ